MHSPLISIIIPVYNIEKYITRCIRSITAQSFQDYELILVDDGSSDDTANLVLRYASQEPNIRLLRQPVNMGKGAAIQAGCLHARGQMMLMVDADGATKIRNLCKRYSRFLPQTHFCRLPAEKPGHGNLQDKRLPCTAI